MQNKQNGPHLKKGIQNNQLQISNGDLKKLGWHTNIQNKSTVWLVKETSSETTSLLTERLLAQIRTDLNIKFIIRLL